MFKRTAWIQNHQFSPEEASELERETLEIRDRLVAIQQKTHEEMERSTMTRNAARAYEGWGHQK